MVEGVGSSRQYADSVAVEATEEDDARATGVS